MGTLELNSIGGGVDYMGFGANTTIIIVQADRCTIAYPSL